MKLKVNWSEKRQRHILDRMLLRGISRREFYDALIKGKKREQKKGIYESVYRYYSIVYEEQFLRDKDIKKIDSITVKLISK
ncbi:hypothetical protein ES705_09732 [subsurface metagenome]|nr:hypothetical protein [Methanosarcinales archaeon]